MAYSPARKRLSARTAVIAVDEVGVYRKFGGCPSVYHHR
jgi:hypothetical protein